MLILPHPVIRRLAEENVEAVSLRVLGVAYGLGVMFDVMICPMGATAAFERSGVEQTRPHMLMWEADAPDRFPIGTLVEEERGMFKVTAPTQTHKFGNSADNCTTVLELLDIEPSGIERHPGDYRAMAMSGGLSQGGPVGPAGGI